MILIGFFFIKSDDFFYKALIIIFLRDNYKQRKLVINYHYLKIYKESVIKVPKLIDFFSQRSTQVAESRVINIDRYIIYKRTIIAQRWLDNIEWPGNNPQLLN